MAYHSAVYKFSYFVRTETWNSKRYTAGWLWLQRPDDGGSKDLRNVGKLLPDYTALQPRRQPSSYSPPWEPQILQNNQSCSWIPTFLRNFSPPSSGWNIVAITWTYKTMVCSWCVWSRHQQALARERYHTGFLLVENRRSAFECGSHHNFTSRYEAQMGSDKSGRHVIVNYACHMRVLVLHVCVLPLYTHTEQSIGPTEQTIIIAWLQVKQTDRHQTVVKTINSWNRTQWLER
jgi:hypothetical protein